MSDPRTDDAVGDSHPSICGLVNKNMPILKRKLEELSSQEADMDELETWCRKANRIKAEYWSMVQPFREGKALSPPQVARVDDLSKEVEEILGHGSFRKGTIQAAGCKKSSPLLTTKLVGDESEGKIKEICDYLMRDEIFIIGIYGIGGVGKTTILMHVHNKVLFENPTFNDVFWITVPQEFSVYELQDEIANAVGLDNLSKYKDVKWRACILDKHLRKKRAVLVLDGLWMHFEVEDVGIPVEKGGLKLVLTTRSLDVCHKMLCQKQIKIQLLDPFDSWSLFKEKLCFGRKLPPEIKGIARSIVDKCEGLPLGIIEIATRMRGLEEVHEWKARVDEQIGGDGCALLSKNVGVLEVERCGGTTSLSEVGPLENLEKLTIKEWEKLEELGAVHFPHLRELNIAGCSKLKNLLEEGQGLPCLQSFKIEGSEELEGIKLAAPSLNHMEVSNCPKMKRAVEWEWLATLLPNLFNIKIKNCEKLEEIISGPLPSGATCLINLLSIKGCNGMKWVLTQDMLLHIPFLREITVDDCKGMKIDVKGCPHLKSIPLQLPLLDNGLPSPPPLLREIKIDNRQTWESLEWDDPLAPSSLETIPPVEFAGGALRCGEHVTLPKVGDASQEGGLYGIQQIVLERDLSVKKWHSTMAGKRERPSPLQ
ncbi:hypothetical protein NL676_024244 [Syzygium grande]|nr:hypothetical protein NL676_024244 [Syzygium grande]